MSRKFFPLLVILLILSLSCSRSLAGETGSTPVFVTPATDLIKETVEALRPPTTIPSPTYDISKGTPTPVSPTPTYPPTSTPVEDPYCYLEMEAFDVTIEDGSQIVINEPFQKTWKLVNTGTCFWTPDFQLVFISEEIMGGQSPVPLGTTVYPNKEIEISVDLVAPAEAGPHIGYWQLQSPDSYSAGWLWVEIEAILP